MTGAAVCTCTICTVHSEGVKTKDHSHRGDTVSDEAESGSSAVIIYDLQRDVELDEDCVEANNLKTINKAIQL